MTIASGDYEYEYGNRHDEIFGTVVLLVIFGFFGVLVWPDIEARRFDPVSFALSCFFLTVYFAIAILVIPRSLFSSKPFRVSWNDQHIFLDNGRPGVWYLHDHANQIVALYRNLYRRQQSVSIDRLQLRSRKCRVDFGVEDAIAAVGKNEKFFLIGWALPPSAREVIQEFLMNWVRGNAAGMAVALERFECIGMRASGSCSRQPTEVHDG